MAMVYNLSAPQTPDIADTFGDSGPILGFGLMGLGSLMILCGLILAFRRLYGGSISLIILGIATSIGGSLAPSIFASPENGSTTPEPSTPTPAPQPEPTDWNSILPLVATIAVVFVAVLITVLALRKHVAARKLQKEQAQREQERREHENPTIRFSDLRGRMNAHHNGSYTNIMVHKANELMLTAPAFFDTSLPEAITYEQAKREATEALEGWDNNTVASSDHVRLVEKVFTTWAQFKVRAYQIGLKGLSPRDIDLVKKYTEALSHGGLNANEHELYLKNLIKLYDKIQYSDSGSAESPEKNLDNLKLHLSGRAITSHAQFTHALTAAGDQLRAIEK